MPYSQQIAHYPFAVMTRARAAELLVWFAGAMALSYQRDEQQCRFIDLNSVGSDYDYDVLINACRY
jgi:hypothetical protein